MKFKTEIMSNLKVVNFRDITFNLFKFIFHKDKQIPTFFFHHTTCESTCDTLTSSAANQGDNTVSVAQGGTATPGATKQLLPPRYYF